MATQRTAKDLAEFVKFVTIGAAIMGRVVEQGENGNGKFVTFAPAAFRASPDAKLERYAELAAGLSTDLLSKVSDGDTGKNLLFVFVGTKPTKKSPMKLFNVVELTNAEAGALFKSGKMDAEWMKAPDVAVSSTARAAVTDDLPF